MNTQVELFAKAVRSDANIGNASFTAIGHSQGGLIVRGYLERYNSPQVHTLISLAVLDEADHPERAGAGHLADVLSELDIHAELLAPVHKDAC